MTLSNLTPTPRATARIFTVDLDLNSGTRKITRKIIAVFYSGSRVPAPRRQIQRVVKATLVRRLNELPGSPMNDSFESIIRQSGLPRFADCIYGLLPSGNLHRISGDITLQYVSNQSIWFTRYVGSGQLLTDLDQIRFWLNSERKGRDMIDNFANVTFQGNIYNVVFGNRVSFTVIRASNNPRLYGAVIGYNLHTFTKELKPSYGMLFTALFLPRVRANIADYDLLYNIKYDTLAISPVQWDAVIEDLLNWFFIGGNVNPKGKKPQADKFVPPSQDQSPGSSSPKSNLNSQTFSSLDSLKPVSRFNFIKSIVIDILTKLDNKDDLNELIVILNNLNSKSFKDSRLDELSYA